MLCAIFAIYFVVALAASWFLSSGYTLDFSPTLLLVLSLMWPLLLALVGIAVLEEWRLKQKKRSII